MKCLNQNCDADLIEKDDNFCYKCGHWTTKGYSFLKDGNNVKSIINGATVKQSGRLTILFCLLGVSIIIFALLLIIRGEDLLKPYFYLKKQAFSYIYGYKTSLMKTDNKYKKEKINSYEDAVEFIIKDFTKQDVYCFNDSEVDILASRLEEQYSIPSVSFCDMSLNESKKIKDVIDKIYLLFPNISGALTNITITNAASKSEYIARFQPMYQFVNIDQDIKSYNKVNKTQILINSYYFLNEKVMDKPLESVSGENWYVSDATWESTIAHEFGHYISFVILLKEYNISNITFVTNDNYKLVDQVINDFNSGKYSTQLLNDALDNYNRKYEDNKTLKEFASSISKYAVVENKNGELIADETIAEAIHDYYLHGENMKPESKEIINIIKSKV